MDRNPSKRGKKIMALSKAAIRAIAIRRKAQRAQERTASNDNQPAPKSAYVDTTMTPGMLAACVAAAGFEG
jgi:hypothetical protein